MADDVVVTSGSYSATVAAQDVAGVHVQEVLLVDGTRAVLAWAKNTAAGTAGVPILAQRVDSAATLADADGKVAFLQMDANGFLRVSLGTALSSSIDSVTAALAAGTNNIGDVDVLTLPALPAGTNAIGKLAANSGVDIGDVDVTSISAGANLIGDVGLQGRTTGGLSMFKSLDLDESEEEVKGSAGTLYGYFFYNAHASALRYLKLYNNTAAGTTVGTTVPDLTIPIKAGGSGHISIPQGLACGTGITAAATTGFADNDTGAPGANEVFFCCWYK